MESDAKKTCDIMTETVELMPEMMKLSMKANLGDEDSKKEAQKKLDEITLKMESYSEEMKAIKGKYDEDEFQEYLLENCEQARNLEKMGKAFE
tara:strand:- start:284 stop:562 length:279 start_codon:yes stop_codon:yes gene_type:complete